jgi:small subunit ribosomal protein S3
MLSDYVKNFLGEENVQIEVEALDEPELFASVMAQRLASSLERGRHFRRSAYGTIRRIMATGALGCEIVVSGKITSQRARIEIFREGFVAKTGQPAEIFVQRGKAKAKIKRGILGISVLIMIPGAVLPDNVNIIAEPTHTTREITKVAEVEDSELTLDDDDMDELEDDFGDLDEIEVEDDDIPADAMEALDEDDLEDLEEDDEEDEE